MQQAMHIFTAGVAIQLVQETIRQWDSAHPELPAVMVPGGSVDLIRKCRAGEPCDLLVMADDTIIASMLMPDFTDGYYIFAGNRMVITANAGESISSEDWKEKLLAPDATFSHFNPYGDPSGYRAVMCMLLADRVEPGLSQKLMQHPGHYGMDPQMSLQQLPKCKYTFAYYSGAQARHTPFAQLPVEMDLSDEARSAEYATVHFDVDAQHRVTGAPIRHALAIPLQSRYRAQARAFAALFLQSDFAGHGFLPRSQAVGNWR